MGYTLVIGEKYIDQNRVKDYIEEDFEEEEAILRSVDAKLEKNDNAPSFGEPTDYENQRWPSYNSWYACISLSGLEDLFYFQKNLKGGHPGFFTITENWLGKLNTKIKEFKNKYPNCQATYDEKHPCNHITLPYKRTYGQIEDYPINSILCRLEWLSFWCNYAFEKYGKKAIFKNS